MEYFEIYKDIWNFHKKFQEVQTTEDYWKEVETEFDRIAKKYDESKFVLNLLFAVNDELERLCKEMKDNSNSRV